MAPAGTGSPRAPVLSWCLYDFANSAFTTLVVTFIYAAYFTGTMVEDPVRGTLLWSRAVGISAVLIALVAPLVGAYADASGLRRRFLAGFTLLCIALTASLAFIGPGRWLVALALFVLANVCFEVSGVLYNSFLPDLAPAEKLGRVSGYGWGLGYAGGLLCLVVGFTMTGLPGHLEPWLSTVDGWNIRATNLLVAGWFLIFSLPFLLQGREVRRKEPVRPLEVLRQLQATVGNLRRFREAALFVVARLLYNDGLVTVFAFGGIYAAGALGMSFGEIVLLGIWLNVAAGFGSVLFGHLDDRIGGKPTILLSLVVLTAATALGAAAPSGTVFWIAATGIGLTVGPNQAASRSLMGRFAPAGKRAEFFGFFAFSGKLTAFAGALLLGQVTAWTGSQRWGMASVIGFFLLGGMLLLFVDERAGIAAAASDS